MPSSRRELIVAQLASRLESIAVADGFNTNLGATVLINEVPLLGEDDPASAVAMLTLQSDDTWQGKAFLVRLPIVLLILVNCDQVADTSDAWVVLEQAIADVRRAIETEDRTLGGLLTAPFGLERGPLETLPREPGTSTLGAVLNYVAPFKEAWGNP